MWLTESKALAISRYITSTQRIVVNGCASEPEVVISGVPQGSVLGSILFLLYINDLPSVVNNSKIKLFADDSKLYFLSEKDSITSDPLNSLRTGFR